MKSAKIKGLTVCYFGNGKGKTTAALGLAFRASGYNQKTVIIQFIKGDIKSGEDLASTRFKLIKIKKMGAGFVLPGDQNRAKHITCAKQALEAAADALYRGYDVVVADEILGAVKAGLVGQKDVLRLISLKPDNTTLVLTGRPQFTQILKKCDLVTQMKKIKHPYDKGHPAIKGVDY